MQQGQNFLLLNFMCNIYHLIIFLSGICYEEFLIVFLLHLSWRSIWLEFFIVKKYLYKKQKSEVITKSEVGIEFGSNKNETTESKIKTYNRITALQFSLQINKNLRLIALFYVLELFVFVFPDVIICFCSKEIWKQQKELLYSQPTALLQKFAKSCKKQLISEIFYCVNFICHFRFDV
eukprot:TRINITY_DN5922_c0_g1_i6.p2 TRINITY_DN5922_c0_g1~~TRINITY_DN5922_c0_g1_i6.p2  ORF type:complete len:208 (-),score=-2.12 TRINITY_DN5922_c0_g1_i6:384-917(-)